MQASIDLVPVDAPIQLGHLKDLFERNQWSALGKFVGDNNMSGEDLLTSLSENVRSRLAKGGALAEAVGEKATGKTVGVVMAEEAPWDTQHFGVKMGKITLAVFDEDVSTAQRADVIGRLSKKIAAKMLSARVNLIDLKTIQAFERVGAILTDVLLTYRLDLAKHNPSDNLTKPRIGPVREYEAGELGQLGRSIFSVDRFHGDPNIPPAKSSELYSKWVSNSVRGQSDNVLVARVHDQVAGFITCKLEQNNSVHKFGVIELVGVRPSFAGRGIGRELVQAALKWFKGRVPSVYVGTQAANTRAVRLYEESRFVYACSEATLHLWLGPVY